MPDDNNDKQIVVHGAFGEMMSQAEALVGGDMVPFKKPQDVLIVMQAAKDYGISLSSALSSLYVINGRLTMGVHIMTSLLVSNGVFIKTINDAVPVTHYITRGGTPVRLTGSELTANFNKYEVITAEDFENGTYDKSKIPLIKVAPPFIDDGSIDLVTTLLFKRKLKQPDGTYEPIEETVSFYLHQAYQAGFMGATIAKPKDNWYHHTNSMLYARCAAIGSKRIAPDILHGMPEVSELADISDVEYNVTDNPGGAPTINITPKS